MHPLLIATNNSHKTEEIAAILGSTFQVKDLSSGSFPKVAETGTTFLENATLKAVEISKLTEGWVLSDDSGLEVDALHGEPGVYSSRYAGSDGDDAANNAKLMRELAKLPSDTARTARFRCVIVIAKNGERLAHFSGSVEGSIVLASDGDHGFGYDPHFQPEGFDKTFAQLPTEVKNSLSHRARAMAQASPWLMEQVEA
ncbi:RdgB/HAM1 family non-canonical purine NTP pyrophosphatase [Rubritalea marina]|uniref:RdgB/HAM1 family non-canonical purine NTP pyrophosphatase n=1 Tax=Rubritalea marina TaxID=361055 RepID=UPI000376ACB9|nr:RdgB/HAM1 family non-canonical purine NTP pyrophosphatase [Rubritalea marina]